MWLGLISVLMLLVFSGFLIFLWCYTQSLYSARQQELAEIRAMKAQVKRNRDTIAAMPRDGSAVSTRTSAPTTTTSYSNNISGSYSHNHPLDDATRRELAMQMHATELLRRSNANGASPAERVPLFVPVDQGDTTHLQ